MQEIDIIIGWQGVFGLIVLLLLPILWAGVRLIALGDDKFKAERGTLGARQFWSLTSMLWFVGALFLNPATFDIVTMMTEGVITYPFMLVTAFLGIAVGQLSLLETIKQYYKLKPPVKIAVLRVVK